jgi:hypothetical protein
MDFSTARENLEWELMTGTKETSKRANSMELVANKNQQWESTKASAKMGCHMVKVCYESPTEIFIMANSKRGSQWVKDEWISSTVTK